MKGRKNLSLLQYNTLFLDYSKITMKLLLDTNKFFLYRSACHHNFDVCLLLSNYISKENDQKTGIF